jgi:hypothetical protein
MMCIRVRWHVSNREGAAIHERVKRHLDGCAACSAYQERLLHLEGSLRAARLSAPLPTTTRQRAARWPLALAGGVAIAVAALLYIQLGASSTRVREAEVSQDTSASVQSNGREPVRVREGSGIGERLVGAHANFVSSMQKLGAKDDPLAIELAAWRRDGLRGLESIRRLGRVDSSAL